MDPQEVKDRILENINLSVKKLQSYFAACEDETPAIRNHDRVLQRLCEHLDHALLYGLQDISSGYWVLVVHFTRREAVKQIEEQQHVATLLGRSRAWLYLALNENSLESYLRLFHENQSLLQKYYYKNALVCSHDHLTLFLTLVSGLEFIRFELELDVPYLDLAPYMPEYYKPQYLLDFEDRLPSSVRGSDSLSLNSFNSINSANLEWDDSAIAPSSEDYDFGDAYPTARSVPSTDWEGPDGTATAEEAAETPDTSDPITQDSEVEAMTTSLDTTLSYNNNQHPARAAEPASDSTDLSAQDATDGLSTSESTPVHTAKRKGANPTYTTYTENHAELEVIRMVRKKRPGKRKKGRSEDGSHRPLLSTSEPEDPDPGACNGEAEEKPSEAGEPALRLPKMQDTSMELVGQPLTEVIEKLNGQLDPRSWAAPNPPDEATDHSFRTRSPGETPGHAPASPKDDDDKGLQDPMDFYYFTPESPNSPAAGGGHNESPGQGQSAHVFGGPEDAEEGGRGTQTPAKGSLEEHSGHTPPTTAGSGGKGSPSLSIAEDSGVDEGQGSPTDTPHPCEFRVDNNLLLLLMIHVFRENEEQLFKMFRMSTGHMEGDLQLVYVLLTDCYIYFLRKGAADKPYTVEEAVSYNELDYISVGLDQQTVMIVCTNRRRQFLVDTADISLTEIFIAALKSAMVNGCREPPYPGVLTDATMERLALAKFVSMESKREASEVAMMYYGLVHWEDPLDEALGGLDCHSSKDHVVSKEGILYYKASTSYLGRETWKTCYVVLSNGILYQYPERTDVTPMLSINLGGEQCGGCRRVGSAERSHSFQVILTEQPSLELSAANEEDMADWMQHLCQAVSKGVIPQDGVPSPCLPCCLVLSQDKIITCHQDCQTNFFRALGVAELTDLSSLGLVDGKEYCVMEFTQERSHFLPPWVVYFSCRTELDRFVSSVRTAWKSLYQVDLPQKVIPDSSVKKCEDAVSLIHSAWQRSDSLCRGRSSRDPWC